MNRLKCHALFFLVTVLICGSLTACGKDDSYYIDFVKDGSPLSYPDKTYGEAFGDFFSSPTWEYFKGSTDDSDDVNDVVEFTGHCTYWDEDATVMIQFTLDVEDESFETTYFELNGEPQSLFMLSALLDAAFE